MEADSKRAILAVILSGLVLFGWQYFFPTPSVTTPTKKDETTVSESHTDDNKKVLNEVIVDTDSNNNKAKVEIDKNLKFITLTNSVSKYTLSSNLEIVEMNSINSEQSYPNFFEEITTKFFLVSDTKRSLFVSFSKVNDAHYDFSDSSNNVNGSLKIDDKGFLNFSIKSINKFNYTFETKTKELKKENQQHNQFFIYDKDLSTYSVGDDDKLESKVKWFATDFNHHVAPVLFTENTLFNINITEEGLFKLSSIASVNELNFKTTFVQKNYDDLINLGDRLEASVEFGIWELIAVPILKGLQFFFSIFPNYGIAIILLTIVIRMLTFPLQYKSFKSMKKMQVIQPELQKIREKYKEDPQRMQKETMGLFKKAGANPLGGCLPLLLQMPIFFAFYKVLYSAVELVDAPFYFWIMDLSEKDPYYILPVLMSIAMFLNTKLTPTATADPAQQKIMMFMPLIFGFIMKDLPSGLTLYIFVSTVVGMLQQLFVYKRVA